MSINGRRFFIVGVACVALFAACGDNGSPSSRGGAGRAGSDAGSAGKKGGTGGKAGSGGRGGTAGSDASPAGQGGQAGGTDAAAGMTGDSGGTAPMGEGGTAGDNGNGGASGATTGRSGGITVLSGTDVMDAMDGYHVELPSDATANPSAEPLPLGVLLFAGRSKTDAIRACGEQRQRSGANLIKVFVAADGQLEPGTYPHQRWTNDLEGELGEAEAVAGTFFAVLTMSAASCIDDDPKPICSCDLVTTALSFAGGELTLSKVDGGFVGQIALDTGGQIWSGDFSLPSCSKTFDQHLAIANGTLECIP